MEISSLPDQKNDFYDTLYSKHFFIHENAASTEIKAAVFSDIALKIASCQSLCHCPFPKLLVHDQVVKIT